ncbi:MAG: YIP1 family protein [Chloroflexota bacterium]|jgi:hypothetical protein|nr:YIP1 family protein [Chloroflexota bacterium]
MLKPKSYPEMMGKALVFEAEPFITMTEDDNPWAEGLFMVALMGLLVGAARVIGSLLLSASMPDPDALLAAMLQGIRQLGPLAASIGLDPAALEGIAQQWRDVGFDLFGYGSGWMRLLWLVLAPMLLIGRWLILGLVCHGVALALGGNGKLNRTLGATALMAAPQMLMLLQVIPFVSVSGLLLSVWSALIVYRAIEVSHDLPWKKAAAVTLTALALLAILTMAGGFMMALITAVWGGAV